MTKLNSIHLAAGMGADLEGELRELENLMEQGVDKAKEIRHQFNHINSLLIGMKYVIDFIEDEEDRKDLGAIVDQYKGFLMSDRREAMQIVYTARIGRKVTIKPDAPGTYALEIAGNDLIGGSIVYGLKDMDEVQKEFNKNH